MTSAQTKVPRGHAAARRGHPQRLRPMALGLLNLLLVQYALGMVVNLYVQVPSGRTGYGAAAPVLMLHAAVGITVTAGAISLAARSVAARAPRIVAPGIIAAVALVAATAGGATFLGSGVSGASLAMALCAAIAISCYGLIIYRMPGSGARQAHGSTGVSALATVPAPGEQNRQDHGKPDNPGH